MKKVPQISVEEAALKICSGDVLVVGGFGMTGTPIHLLDAIAETNVKDLTMISNNIGEPGLGGGRMLRNGQISKAIGSFFTTNPEVVSAYQSGEIEVDLLPQGNLAEAIRAGGAGLGGFLTPTGVGTSFSDGRKIITNKGKDYIVQPALRADVALIRAWQADTAGNLCYRMTENNFNQAAATAAKLVIVEAETIVPVGQLDPNHIHTPGCFVDYLVQAHTTVEDLGTSASVKGSLKKTNNFRMNMAQAALQELNSGDVVNLGVGIPTLVADLITPESGITLHSENGMLGVGPEPESGGALDYPVNAGKIPVTALSGSSYFDSTTSFAMIRGGHLDAAILGGLQVDEKANLANWAVPGKPLLGIGGAMDLAAGAKKVIVTMMHTDREGNSKVVRDCTLPLTAIGAVTVLITELGKFRFIDGELTLVEVMPGATLEEIYKKTAANYSIDC
ncbi:MAG: succinyl-CoA--3-ketoacid-CoA transferase [Rhodospirillaceae bacterium]|nr:succinyl-CoA--3-ketoacid-CoA transferase [Rhodospirillaceae bacterium]